MPSHPPSSTISVRDQLMQESIAMAQYALASGMNVSPAAAATLERARAASAEAPVDIAAMVKVHDQLFKLVAPATPRALLLLGPDHVPAGGLKAMLGSVGLVRRMMVAAIGSIVVYILVGLSPDVSATPQTVQSGKGIPLLLNELAWLSAAAMGASFAILMQVSGYVVKRNYDPRYEPSYWIKFFLGVMAGFILVQLVPLSRMTGTDGELSQLMLALIGGFSASAVFRILTRLVEAVESVFRGDAKDELVRRENDARSRASEETAQVKLGFAAQVVRLQQEVSTGADPASLSARLREMLAALVPDTALEPVEAPAPASAETPAEAAPGGTIALPGVSVVSDAASQPAAG